MATPSAFPLRFHDQRVRNLVRELSDRAKISQNEFIERAVEREVVLQGALVAQDLAAAAQRLALLSEEQHRALVARSHEAFVAGEALVDPIEARALPRDAESLPTATAPPTVTAPADPLGVLAAFDAAAKH